MAGFLETVHRPPPAGDASVRFLVPAHVRRGRRRHFMFPYNEKLWRAELGRMTTEWQGALLPKPRAAEVLYGALLDQNKLFGYNADFRYPVRGGIQVLPDAFAARYPAGALGSAVAARRPAREGGRRGRPGRGALSSAWSTRCRSSDFLDLAAPCPAPVAPRPGRAALQHRLQPEPRDRPRRTSRTSIGSISRREVFRSIASASRRNFSRSVAPRGTARFMSRSRAPCRDGVGPRRV